MTLSKLGKVTSMMNKALKYGDDALKAFVTKLKNIPMPIMDELAIASGGSVKVFGKGTIDDYMKMAKANFSKGSGAVDDVAKKASGLGKNIENVNPSEIRFSQTSVNGSDEIIASMKANGWKGDPIDVVRMPDGSLTTLDNTRVAAAREVGIDVQATVRNYNDPLPPDMVARFTTPKGVPKTWGEATDLRIGKQKASFRNNNPMGSFDLEKMK
ncbi:hypothetical protein [Enterococcus sp. UD-01]|jgi:hypothetical protein|uniref:hypothetical protein n=1 Tax=Enterococcus sp. UD-01 TaxID=3373911 RepID=UPI0038393987